MLLVKYKKSKREKIIDDFDTLTKEEQLKLLKNLEQELNKLEKKENSFLNKVSNRVMHRDNILYDIVDTTGFLGTGIILTLINSLIALSANFFKFYPIKEELRANATDYLQLQLSLEQLKTEELHFFADVFAGLEAITVSGVVIFFLLDYLKTRNYGPSNLEQSQYNIKILIKELKKELNNKDLEIQR
ncbi:MAG: hypothetical protein IJZ29_03680 [Clostridia bacterium]|nr:hypothetical protein [Clostridia bacterium]